MIRRLLLFIVFLLCLICAAMALLWQLTAIIFSPARSLHIAVAWDQLANATWGNSEDETISSRLGRCGPRWAELAVNWIFERLTGEKNHCKNNIEQAVR